MPGKHTYVFNFHPRTHDVGLTLTTLTVLAAVVWAGSVRLKKRV
ncbi:MAG: hypothetical protein R6X18_14185 [Chloroflexota bacterium]|jgi:hypothetical protein